MIRCTIGAILGLLGVAAGIQAAEKPGNDPILEGADARIRQTRMGDLEVRVLDAEGKPVAGAQVAIEQTQHEFLFGCNIFKFERFPTPEENERYKSQFNALFNFATLPFYWAGFERKKGEPQYERIERVARWCRKVGITPKGHPLVWNHRAGTPGWLPKDPDEVRKLSDARVKACVERFKGLTDIFDVVNEAADPLRPGFENPISDLIRKIGIEDFTRTPFRIAREANPGAVLLINDYRTDAKYEKVVQFLKVDGKPLYDVIGIQSHMHGGAWPSKKVWQVCERYAKYGVPIHFTETTIVSGPKVEGKWRETTPECEERQARDAVRFYTVLFSHPSVEAITWWDFCDRGAWQGAPAGFLRKDLSPKPVYTELLKKIKGEWWTKTEGKTDAEGILKARAFYGSYRVTARGPDGREAAADVELSRKKGQAVCTLRLP